MNNDSEQLQPAELNKLNNWTNLDEGEEAK